MAFTTGMTLVLDPKQSIELLWGGGKRVWNFFCKNELQPTTAVYLANCASFGGDSDGWRTSLQSYSALRVRNGFHLGNLAIGFPGSGMLEELSETAYGTRWLGILCILATIPNEDHGGVNLRKLLFEVASESSRVFLLTIEQCEQLWGFSREIFADSPFWHGILEITSRCLLNSDAALLTRIFPPEFHKSGLNEQEHFLLHVLRPCFDLWQLSKKPETRNERLWARGSIGCSQIIFYLTAVCGFRVSLQGTDATFGQPGDDIQEVVIEISLREEDKEWTIGYFVDNQPLEYVVGVIIPAKKATEWRNSLLPNLPPNPTTYRVDLKEYSPSIGECLHPEFISVRKEMHAGKLQPFVSRWYADTLNRVIYYHRLTAPGAFERNAFYQTSTALARLSERLDEAIGLFAPGILQPDRQQVLIQNVRENERPERLDELNSYIPTADARKFCNCHTHGGNDGRPYQGGHDQMLRCRIQHIASVLDNRIPMVWLASQISMNMSQLRDLYAHNIFWNVQTYDLLFPLWSTLAYLEDDIVQYHQLDRFLCVIATQLAGRKMKEIDNCLGRAAGGFAIGIVGNEAVPLITDPGFTIYIYPGAFSTSERRANSVIYEAAAPLSRGARQVNRLLSENFADPRNDFTDVKLSHTASISSEKIAKLSSEVSYCGNGSFQIAAPIATARIVNISIIEGCLGRCVRDKLRDSDLRSVLLFLPETEQSVGTKVPPLLVLPAHGNSIIQRALLSADVKERGEPHVIAEPIAIMMGRCVHCAIQQSLDRGIRTLFL